MDWLVILTGLFDGWQIFLQASREKSCLISNLKNSFRVKICYNRER